MKIVLIFFNLIMLVQGPCAGCPACPPCCSRPGGCGPPPPPGFPIDDFVFVLFFAALMFGVYTINKRRRAA